MVALNQRITAKGDDERLAESELLPFCDFTVGQVKDLVTKGTAEFSEITDALNTAINEIHLTKK